MYLAEIKLAAIPYSAVDVNTGIYHLPRGLLMTTVTMISVAAISSNTVWFALRTQTSSYWNDT